MQLRFWQIWQVERLVLLRFIPPFCDLTAPIYASIMALSANSAGTDLPASNLGYEHHPNHAGWANCFGEAAR